MPWKLPAPSITGPPTSTASSTDGLHERPGRGDKVLLVPGHCDPTVNLHDWYVGVRGFGTAEPRVEGLWPVAARGALF